jgi:Na+/H+ antiporter NhaD/arsenite permease-like protein
VDSAVFVPSIPWVAPFVILLLGIAIFPLALPHFWESNLRKLVVSIVLGGPVLALYALHHPMAIGHTATDYVSFMVLLGSLYVISGGVLMDGDLEATPFVNTLFLAGGALLASVVGTTGASMLLIRPLLHTNAERRHVVHTVVFFIFLVSNVGGCLTPLGDPPLFLGYLMGVPFTWTLRLFPAWLATVAMILVVYYVWDTRAYETESPGSRRADRTTIEPLTVKGRENLALLLGIVLATAFLGAPFRELAMVALAGLSLARTPRAVRTANHFSFHPVLEVAVIFAGIFLTMMPALDLLRARGGELGVREPWHFFWATGFLSSFLDNAPTYLTFVALGQGQRLAAEVVGLPHEILQAISLGAVFMGANTYIGNGPNFLVRSIAESRGIKMPGFGGYMLYSGTVLLPVFLIVTVMFFR